MSATPPQESAHLDTALWPLVDQVCRDWAVPGAAVVVVRDGAEVVTRGFGTRDPRATGHAGAGVVTADTMFHLASISKTFVATAILRLVERGELDLHGRVTAYLPGLSWTDPRAADITLAHLLSHTSGIGDVTDYGWHAPQLDDDALRRFASEVAGWPLVQDPGVGFSYSNAAYEVLGHLLSTVSGQSFEEHLREHVLTPAGMEASTFRRAEVPPDLAAAPHLGLPPRVLEGAYPYTRQHAPSSTLHSSAAELGRWMIAHLSGFDRTGILSAELHAQMWEPLAEVPGWGDLSQQMCLGGWFRGTHRGHTVIGHAGEDPGFQCYLVLVPELGIGSAVLVNTNTAPVFGLSRLVLDVLLGHEPEVPLPPVTVDLGEVLATGGVDAAIAHFRAMEEVDPPSVDLDEEGFEAAVWGAIEMHRGELVQEVLEVWRTVQPESSLAWGMTGWAQKLAGDTEGARGSLERALELDVDNDDARSQLQGLA